MSQDVHASLDEPRSQIRARRLKLGEERERVLNVEHRREKLGIGDMADRKRPKRIRLSCRRGIAEEALRQDEPRVLARLEGGELSRSAEVLCEKRERERTPGAAPLDLLDRREREPSNLHRLTDFGGGKRRHDGLCVRGRKADERPE